jgi:DNA-directed RNA polymerase subunit beta'
LQFDGLRTVSTENAEGKKIQVVIGRTGEIRNIDVKSDRLLNSMHIPYGSVLNVKDGQKVTKGDVICTWDPFNNVIVAEVNGSVQFEALIEGVTYRDEADEQTGHRRAGRRLGPAAAVAHLPATRPETPCGGIGSTSGAGMI